YSEGTGVPVDAAAPPEQTISRPPEQIRSGERPEGDRGGRRGRRSRRRRSHGRDFPESKYAQPAANAGRSVESPATAEAPRATLQETEPVGEEPDGVIV